MKNKWQVSSNFIGNEELFIVFRLRDSNKVDHSGNREYASEYMKDREAAEAIAKTLNEEERALRECQGGVKREAD